MCSVAIYLLYDQISVGNKLEGVKEQKNGRKLGAKLVHLL